MSRKTRGKGKIDSDRDERSRLLRAAGLAGAVLGLVLVGWFLQADPSEDSLYPAGPAPDHPGDTGEMTPAAESATLQPAESREPMFAPQADPEAAPEAVLQPAPEPGAGADPGTRDPSAWSRRLHDEVERLGSRTGEWTLQLIVACDPRNVARLLDAAGDDDALHLIPAEINGRECFRLCWGAYRDREQALAAALPGSLRANLEESPQPRPIEGLLP